MKTIFAPTAPVATQASRAIGAMFFSVFGGLWLAFWAHETFVSIVPCALIVLATIAYFSMVRRIYKLHAPALRTEPRTRDKRRVSRRFHLVNAAQWILIIVVANVLENIGLALWTVPAVILIIGLHFLPLAKLFAYPPHYLTGAAMILVAILYPAMAPAGASSPVGCLGAGLVLWISAAWAVTRVPGREARRLPDRRSNTLEARPPIALDVGGDQDVMGTTDQ